MEAIDFLVIGAQKAGTTTLWQLLRGHPQLWLPASKEAPFFSEPEYADGLEAFMRAHFGGDGGDGRMRGTVTPQYMMGTPQASVEVVAQRIAQAVPRVRLVALLRDPVERAISQWRMSRRWGVEQRELDQALSDELRPEALAAARMAADPTNSYVVQGEYGRTLGDYLRRFPREQLHVELTQTLDGDPAGTLARILAFLGVDAGWQSPEIGRRWFEGGERARVPRPVAADLFERLARDVFPLAGDAADDVARAYGMAFEVWNVVPEPQPRLDPEVERALRDHYAADVAAAEELLRMSLPWGASGSVAASRPMRAPRWPVGRFDDAVCPLCADAEAKRTLIELDAGRLVLLVCGRCSLHFFPALDPTRYATLDDEFGLRGFELALGFHGSVECLGRIDTSRVRRYLEVGCGTGLTLDFARRVFGWQVQGVDDGAWSRAARDELDVPMVAGLLGQDAAVEERAWDLVFACEVIEHVPDPLPFLAAVRSVLTDDGVFLLRTPAAERLDRDGDPALLNAMLSPGFHTMLHTAESLELALRSAGFTAVEVIVRDATLHAAASTAPFTWRPDGTVPSELLRDFARGRASELPPASAARLGLTQVWADEAVTAGDREQAAAALSQLDAALRARHGAGLDVAADAVPAGAETLYCFALATSGRDALAAGDAAAAADAYARSAAAGEAALAALGEPGAVDHPLQVTAHTSAFRAAALSGDVARLRELEAGGGAAYEQLLLTTLAELAAVGAWETIDVLEELVEEALAVRSAGGRATAADHEARLSLALLTLLHHGQPQAAAATLEALAGEPDAPDGVRASALFHAGYAHLQSDERWRARSPLVTVAEGAPGCEPYVDRARELLAAVPAESGSSGRSWRRRRVS